jgi:hypothetical protein
MALTTAQKSTLKAAILADSTLNAFPNTNDGNFDLAVKLSTELASPNFTVWRSNVPITAVGDNIVATELAGLTSLNATRLQTIGLYSADGVNPSMVDRRQFFDDVFSGAGGVLTRAKLLILWKRLATRIEKIFATGTGSDASPATMGYEGAITGVDVADARNS